jgi:hypothetical protein
MSSSKQSNQQLLDHFILPDYAFAYFNEKAIACFIQTRQGVFGLFRFSHMMVRVGLSATLLSVFMVLVCPGN